MNARHASQHAAPTRQTPRRQGVQAAAPVAARRPAPTRTPALTPAFTPSSTAAPPLRCACGGGCPRCTSTDNSRTRHFEREADRAASHAAAAPLPASAASAPTRSGGGLPAPLRHAMEQRLGGDFSRVRVHHDAAAAATAQAWQAQALTRGNDLVFNRGRYQPDTTAGRHLLAHELAHTLQQQRHADAPRVQRKGLCDDADTDGAAASTPTPSRPGAAATPGPLSGVSVFPSAAGPLQLLGQRLPLPASLRATNALGTGGGPNWVLDVAPQQLVLSLLDRVDLQAGPHAGTSEGSRNDPLQQSRISLRHTLLRLDPASGRLRGTATLEVPTQYPLTLTAPTSLEVQIESTELGRLTGQVGYGPAVANFELKLRYDTARLESALRPVLAPAGGVDGLAQRLLAAVRQYAPALAQSGPLDARLRALLHQVASGQAQPGMLAERVLELVAQSIPEQADRKALCRAISNLQAELTHPGFQLQGGLGLNVPGLGRLPLSRFSASAPTTLPLARPLLGAPSNLPLTYQAGGIVLAPPGAVTDVAVPALGYTYSSFGAQSGTAFTAAALPTLSPAAMGTPGATVAEKFPVYVFAEFSHVRRVSNALDLGLRLTAQFSTPDLFGRSNPGGGSGAGATVDIGAEAARFQQAGDPKAAATPIVPNIGAAIYGRFGGPI